MNDSHDLNQTVDVPSVPGDSLDAGLAAGFAAPRSSLGDMRPVLLKEAQGESDHVVRPSSDAMPDKEERIIARRLAEHEANMRATLEGIKAYAESKAA